MNTQTKQALEMVVEALETEGNFKEAVDACKKALAQPQPKLFLDLSNSNGNHPVQQEPVAWQWLKSGHMRKKIPKTATLEHWRPLYTHPAPSWQGLSDDEIDYMWEIIANVKDFARAIEAAHGIKVKDGK